MDKARSQAKTRKYIAYIFFVLFGIKIIRNIISDTTVEEGQASGSEAMVMEYMVAFIYFFIGWIFHNSSKNKLLQAESEESRSSKN